MLRAYLYLIFFVPWTLFCSVAAIAVSFIDGSGGMCHRCACLWSRVGLAVAGIKVRIEGSDLVPRDQPVIFMGNHQGNFDILALFMAIPRKFSWLAKEELFRVPVFGHCLRTIGYIPLNRGDGREALRSLDKAAEKISSGTSVTIFPEGTRTHDGSLLPFKKGGFILAAKAGVPIVPFTINGSRQINPRNRIELYPGTMSIRFGTPIKVEIKGSRQRDELLEQVRHAIAAYLETTA